MEMRENDKGKDSRVLHASLKRVEERARPLVGAGTASADGWAQCMGREWVRCGLWQSALLFATAQLCLRPASAFVPSPAAQLGTLRAGVCAARPPLKRTLHRGQGIGAAAMGLLRVITSNEIPVDCSEPVDPKALATARAVIDGIR